MQDIEIIQKVKEIIDANTDDPADDMIKLGETLATVGKILKGKSRAQCIAIIRSVQDLSILSNRNNNNACS